MWLRGPSREDEDDEDRGATRCAGLCRGQSMRLGEDTISFPYPFFAAIPVTNPIAIPLPLGLNSFLFLCLVGWLLSFVRRSPRRSPNPPSLVSSRSPPRTPDGRLPLASVDGLASSLESWATSRPPRPPPPVHPDPDLYSVRHPHQHSQQHLQSSLPSIPHCHRSTSFPL
ncbi:hypothetical protein OH76DRAFT_1179680 [Lentinus brumalis]|uniref:Uncharacterized protein n=1 Tax=Lentinus brumalis TaxID=2498619 RepID=A0A371CTY7_9APHY|nr:hypothetical protein OH76DRAFT_1179680 [Polyporus brumalis]